MATLYASYQLTSNGNHIYAGDREYDSETETNVKADAPFIVQVKEDPTTVKAPSVLKAWYGKEQLTLGQEVNGEFGPGFQVRGKSVWFTIWFRKDRNDTPIIAVTRFIPSVSAETQGLLDDLGL